MRSTPCDLVGKGTCDCASKIQATLFLKLRHFPLCGQTPSKCSYVIVRQPMAQTDSSLSHTHFGALFFSTFVSSVFFLLGFRFSVPINTSTGQPQKPHRFEVVRSPSIQRCFFLVYRNVTVRQLTGGSLEPLRIPPSTHSKPCLPSTGSPSHTATKTHFAPDEQQLWRWKHICSLRAAPAEPLQNCSSVQARRNSKGPTEYSKLPVFFCAVAM